MNRPFLFCGLLRAIRESPLRVNILMVSSATVLSFLYHRKRKIDLAVLHCLDTSKTWIGKQLPAGVARFFILWEIAQNRPCRFALLRYKQNLDRQATSGGCYPLFTSNCHRNERGYRRCISGVYEPQEGSLHRYGLRKDERERQPF